jgi:mono/diheme cytochrome c family protein
LESEYESRLLMGSVMELMQKLAIKSSRSVRIPVLLFALAMAVGPALAQTPRGSQTPARPGQPAAPAPGPAEPASIDAGKNGEQLFRANCSECHKTATGLSRGGGILGVQSFLRTHYTASRESAAVLAAYLNAMDAAARPGDRPARRSARPDARPAKKDQGRAPEAKPTEARPAPAKPEESPRPPTSVPAAESQPAEPPPAPPAAPVEPQAAPPAAPAEPRAAPPAAPAEQSPADAPKAE